MEIAGFVSYSVVIIVDWRCIQPFPNFSIVQYNWQAKSELSGLRINLEKFAAGRTTRFIFGFSPQAAAAAKIEHDDDGGWFMMTTAPKDMMTSSTGNGKVHVVSTEKQTFSPR